MFKKIKRILTAATAFVAVFTLCACSAKQETTVQTYDAPEVTGEFRTTVLKTGKSDAIILESASAVVLIDCGEENDGDEVVEYLQQNGISKVDYLVITHFDQDHVGGAAEVIENIDVGEIIAPDYEGSNSEYTNFITAAANTGRNITRLTESRIVTLDDVLYEIYPPLRSDYEEDDNDYSIVIKATHGEDTFLFAGDAEEERLKELYGQLDLSADFLKVPHHGRIDDESESFIKAVSPEYAVITCNKKEGAEEELMQILHAAGVQIYLNREGTITAVSSGKGITVTQSVE